MGNLQSFLKVIKKEVQPQNERSDGAAGISCEGVAEAEQKVGESEAKEPKSRPKKESKKEVKNGR